MKKPVLSLIPFSFYLSTKLEFINNSKIQLKSWVFGILGFKLDLKSIQKQSSSRILGFGGEMNTGTPLAHERYPRRI
jgi:hypothetical protein